MIELTDSEFVTAKLCNKHVHRTNVIAYEVISRPFGETFSCEVSNCVRPGRFIARIELGPTEKVQTE